MKERSTRTGSVTATPARALCTALLALFAAIAPALAEPSIGIEARREADSIILRWIPADPAVWRAGLASGYRIERSDGAVATVVVPWTESAWRSRASSRAVDARGTLARTITAIVYDTASVERDASDDGGLEYEGSREDARYGTAMLIAAYDASIAEGLGLRFVDRSVRPGATYTYCVSINAPSRTADRGCVTVDARLAAPVPKPESLAAEAREANVRLSWSLPRNRELLGFDVERIDVATGEVLRLTPAPILVPELDDATEQHTATLTDTTVRAGAAYRYEVRSLTGFGQKSAPASLDVRIATKQRSVAALAAPPSPRTFQRGTCRLEIAWDLPPEIDPSICIRVERSRSLFDGYAPVAMLCGAERSVIDSSASRRYPYYRLVFSDSEGREQAGEGVHVSFVDSIPPTSPVELSGTIDGRGIVALKWRRGHECDIRGYSVFWANDPTHQFVPRTRALWSDTTFADTVNIETLTRRVFYRVVAVDYTGLASPFSTTLELERPDLLRPLPPVIVEAGARDGGVMLRWTKSPSADVARQHIERRDASDAKWMPIALLPAATTEHLDTSVPGPGEYLYRLHVEDTSGNRSSEAGPIRVRAGAPVDRIAIRKLVATVEPASRSVELRWEVVGEVAPDAWFIILRVAPAGDLEAIATAGPDARAFVDRNLREPGEYVYAIQIARGQWRSETSDRITVALP